MSKESRPGSRRAALWVPAVVLMLSFGGACDSAQPPTGPSAAPTPSPSSPAVTRYAVSGRLTDEGGVPIAGASVQVAYHRGSGGASDPPSLCPNTGAWCWLKAPTDGGGGYRADVEAWPDSRYPGTFGHAYAFVGGFEANVQFLPTGATAVVRDLRLRRIRTIAPGDSITLSVEPDSSLCSDLEDLWAMTSRCEIVRIAAATPGTLVVEARAAEAGGSVPVLFWATTGNYAGIPNRPGPGAVSIPVGGGIYQLFVGIPTGSSSERFDVSASLR
jgi:hypothetical protein